MKEEPVPGPPIFCTCALSDDDAVPVLRVIAWAEEHTAVGVKPLVGFQVFLKHLSIAY